MTYSGQVYICSAGETFDGIALEIYGDEKYACDLLCMNPDYCLMTVFKGGEELMLPVVEIVDESKNDGIMPETAPWKEAN
ncbi:MAG: LysM domain-containing protein [Lachnospiraceae bacterium]|nr:LysM domain-containing protein [Lachnospiraceae bacterium]